ncbi:MAG: FAD-binding protein [Actinomycetota bacterium]
MPGRSATDPKVALARLREIMVDPRRFTTDADVLSGYLEPGARADGLVAAVYPRSAEDIRQVLDIARAYGLAVYTPIPWGLKPPRPGVVLDYEYMADVKGVDTRNLFLEVEPGVTWEQVLPELAAEGVRVALPAAAHSPYVLESAMERDVVLPACRFSNKQFATFHAVLADGREYRSGSDALPNSVAHWREDGGPNISRVFTGSRNSFGLPTRGFIYLYPEPEERKVVCRGLANRRQACRLAQRAARSEIGTEVVILNRLKARETLGEDPGLATWNVVLGLEGSARLVAHQEKRLGGLASELKLTPKAGGKKLAEAFSESLGRPWYAPPVSFGFYTDFDRVETLCEKAEAALAGARTAQMLIPVKRGASVYVQYDIPGASAEVAKKVKRLLPRLADAGAFFNNPTLSLASHIFAKQPAYLELVKDLKRFMDPEDLLNCGQVVEV